MATKLNVPPTNVEIIETINNIIDDKQDKLVSGTNIKTINNTSLLGSGNIDIQSGDNVFIATYNETTYAEILGAFQQNKSIFVRYDDDEFEFLTPLVAVDEVNSTAFFSMVGEANLFIISVESPYLWGTYSAQLGTVKSVNNIQPDSNGNVTLSIPSPVTVDNALSTTSENPVQNKVITDALNGKADDSDVIKKDGGATVQTISLSSGTGTTALGVKSRSTASSYISFTSSSVWLGSIGVNSNKKPVFYNGTGYTLATTDDIPIIATSVLSSSTNAETVGAKLFYDTCGDIETLINAL